MFRIMALCFALLAPAAAAQDFSALDRPGAVALMRHAQATEGTDGDDFSLRDCATQRRLDAAGRDQARRIGAAMQEAGLEIDRVWSSPYCRCLATAEFMGVGPVEEMAALTSYEGLRAPEKTQAVIDRIAALPDDETVLVVTHQVNLAALSGVVAEPGEVVIVARGAEAPLIVLDRVLIAP
jgi:phosphohistidine phosphatase SixA